MNGTCDRHGLPISDSSGKCSLCWTGTVVTVTPPAPPVFIEPTKFPGPVTFHGPQFPNLPKEPEPAWLDAMRDAYSEVANEHHEKRIRRVYDALRKAMRGDKTT